MPQFPIFPLRGGIDQIAKWANQFKGAVEETATDVTGIEEDTTNIKQQKYIVVEAASLLENERVLTAESGVLELTDAGAGLALTVSITVNGVTFGKIQQVATASILGRTTAATGDVEALTGTQATALLDAFTGDSGAGGVKGLVPVPASGDAGKYLDGDGSWMALPKATAIADLTQTISNPPTQTEVQDISDKIDALLAALRAADLLAT